MKKVKEENESKTRVLTINDVSTEIVETSLKSVVVNGVSLTLSLTDKFHSQIVEWDSENQVNIFHREVRETSMLFNVFNVALSKVESDREYLISKVFAELKNFYAENKKVAVMPTFMPALLLGAKGFIAHTIRPIEGEEVQKMNNVFIISEAPTQLPQMLVQDVMSWKPIAHTRKEDDK